MQLSTPPISPRPTSHVHRTGVYVRVVRPVLGALLVALLVAPVAALVAAIASVQWASRRSLADVFFVQERAGRHGEPFRILKFRTLESAGDGTLRPTAFGGLLRRSHLDELPQLWNVVRRDMSLIGPRPETLDIEAWAAERIPGFSKRLEIRPGITGLAQVVQDSTPAVLDDYREKLRLNEAYLASISLRTDLSILLRTALRPFRPRPFPSSAILERSETSSERLTRQELEDRPFARGGPALAKARPSGAARLKAG